MTSLKKVFIIKQSSTIFLRSVIWLIGILVIAVCTFVLPAGISTDQTGYYRPILLGMYVSAIPFFIALYQAVKLLGYIDKKKAFSEASVAALKNVKYCAFIISGLYALGMPYIFYVADLDDAPGVAAIGFVIAVATAVFQGLIQNAVDIKSENDLTV